MANELHFETYPVVDAKKAPTGEFGWRMQDRNAHLTAIGGEGFTRRDDAHRAIGGAVADFVEIYYVSMGFTETISVDVAKLNIVDLDEHGKPLPAK